MARPRGTKPPPALVSKTGKLADHASPGSSLAHWVDEPLRAVGDRAAVRVGGDAESFLASAREAAADPAALKDATNQLKGLHLSNPALNVPAGKKLSDDEMMGIVTAKAAAVLDAPQVVRLMFACVPNELLRYLPVGFVRQTFGRAFTARLRGITRGSLTTTLQNDIREALGRTLPQVDAHTTAAYALPDVFDASDLGGVSMPGLADPARAKMGTDHITFRLAFDPKEVHVPQAGPGLVLVLGEIDPKVLVEVKGMTNVADGLAQVGANFDQRVSGGFLQIDDWWYMVKKGHDPVRIVVAPDSPALRRVRQELARLYPDKGFAYALPDGQEQLLRKFADILIVEVDKVLRAVAPGIPLPR